MNFAEYRTEFQAFQTALNLALCQGWRSVNPTEPMPGPVFSRFQDLFTDSGLDTLSKEREAARPRGETERRAIATLIVFAQTEFVEMQAREVSLELARATAKSQLHWKSEPLGFFQAERRLAQLHPRQHPEDLTRQWENVLASLGDLYAERIVRLDEGAARLGASSWGTLQVDQAQAFGCEFSSLLSLCESFLRLTENQWGQMLSLWANELRRPVASLRRADCVSWAQVGELVEFFPASKLVRSYDATVRGFGVRPWQQPALRLQAVSQLQPYCARVQIPDDVRVGFQSEGGWNAFIRFFQTAAVAQQAVWTSRQLPIELRYGADGSVCHGFAALFGQLLLEKQWLGEMLDLPLPQRILGSARRARLWELREAATSLVCAARYFHLTPGLPRPSLEQIARRFSELMQVEYTPSEALFFLNRGFEAGATLRAHCFEAQFRDYVKTRFGYWWRSRRAGDVVIDLWNTGHRYTLEELAAQIGLGLVTAEALSEDWNA